MGAGGHGFESRYPDPLYLAQLITLHVLLTMCTCPVCGLDQLDEAPVDWAICPCCLTQSDYTDSPLRYAELRADGLATGAQWQSRYVAPPQGWNPIAQLLNLADHTTASAAN